MPKKKCHHCGLVDSIHADDWGKSKLVSAIGPTDHTGKQMYFLYCRSCKHMSIFHPSWIPLKWNFQLCWSPEDIGHYYPMYRLEAENGKPAGVPRSHQMQLLNNLDAAITSDGLIRGDRPLLK